MQSDSQTDLVDAADRILTTWQTYNDEQADIQAFTGDLPHNTVTPIARIRDGLFELDLVLRNNRTTEEYPDGIFHPHADVHHIKKENIGLIEVMGLAVLPARLQAELAEIKKSLLGEDVEIAAYHEPWVADLKEYYGVHIGSDQVDDIIETELGNKFARVLADAGVLKDQVACERFVKTLQEEVLRDVEN